MERKQELRNRLDGLLVRFGDFSSRRLLAVFTVEGLEEAAELMGTPDVVLIEQEGTRYLLAEFEPEGRDA